MFALHTSMYLHIVYNVRDELCMRIGICERRAMCTDLGHMLQYHFTPGPVKPRAGGLGAGSLPHRACAAWTLSSRHMWLLPLRARWCCSPCTHRWHRSHGGAAGADPGLCLEARGHAQLFDPQGVVHSHNPIPPPPPLPGRRGKPAAGQGRHLWYPLSRDMLRSSLVSRASMWCSFPSSGRMKKAVALPT